MIKGECCFIKLISKKKQNFMNAKFTFSPTCGNNMADVIITISFSGINRNSFPSLVFTKRIVII